METKVDRDLERRKLHRKGPHGSPDTTLIQQLTNQGICVENHLQSGKGIPKGFEGILSSTSRQETVLTSPSQAEKPHFHRAFSRCSEGTCTLVGITGLSLNTLLVPPNKS
jgi:hypothetical protein